MKATRLTIPDVVLLEPFIHSDIRGYFYESFQQHRYEALLGRPLDFTQDNQSFSKQHVLRGLHYQHQAPQAKLVCVVVGKIFDVAVDLRQSSSHFGQWVGQELSAENHYQLFIPEGFAHGFVVLSDCAIVSYKNTGYYQPEDQHTLAWDDASVAIAWPVTREQVILSPRDRQGRGLSQAVLFD